MYERRKTTNITCPVNIQQKILVTYHGLMIKRINSFFSVSKKVKIDKTQQTDPGGGGQAEHEDEGRYPRARWVETQAKICPREWDLFV